MKSPCYVLQNTNRYENYDILIKWNFHGGSPTGFERMVERSWQQGAISLRVGKITNLLLTL